MAAQFQFMMRSGPTPGKIFPLEGSEIIIGRENTCSLSINDAEVSRKHSRLYWQGSGYVIEDCGSTNGTYCNQQRLTTPMALHGGELISLGENIALVYEAVVVDPNATIMSGSAKKAVEDFSPEPSPSQRVPQTPPPAPVASFVGQVPANPPVRQAPAPAPKRKKGVSKILIVIVIALVLLCVCAVATYFLWTAPMAFWCKTFPFYFKPELYPQCVL
jgi:hypothetical protein